MQNCSPSTVHIRVRLCVCILFGAARVKCRTSSKLANTFLCYFSLRLRSQSYCQHARDILLRGTWFWILLTLSLCVMLWSCFYAYIFGNTGTSRTVQYDARSLLYRIRCIILGQTNHHTLLSSFCSSCHIGIMLACTLASGYLVVIFAGRWQVIRAIVNISCYM